MKRYVDFTIVTLLRRSVLNVSADICPASVVSKMSRVLLKILIVVSLLPMGLRAEVDPNGYEVKDLAYIGNHFTPRYNESDSHLWTMTTAGFDALSKTSLPDGSHSIVDSFVGGGGGASPSTMAVLTGVGAKGMIALYDCNYGGTWFLYDADSSAKSSMQGTPGGLCNSGSSGVAETADGTKIIHRVDSTLYLVDPIAKSFTTFLTDSRMNLGQEIRTDGPRNTLYVHHYPGATGHKMYAVDLATGTITEVAVGIDAWWSTIVDQETGYLYLVIENRIYEIDPVNGVSTLLTLPEGVFSGASSFAPATGEPGQSFYGLSGTFPNYSIAELSGAFPFESGSGNDTEIVVFQPSGGNNDGSDDGSENAGKDAAAVKSGDTGTTNYGDVGSHHHWNSTCNQFFANSYYEFNLDELPAAADAIKVELVLYEKIERSYGWPYQGGNSTTMDLHLVTSAWNESTITWQNQPTIGDLIRSTLIETQASTGIVFEGYVRIDITDTYKAWKSGALANYGVRYYRPMPWCENANGNYVYSSDHPDSGTHPSLEITVPGIDAEPDIDSDGVPDTVDNCVMTANPDQADADGDGIGDVCELDTDADTVIDDLDNCPMIPNPNQADADGDGLGDACEADTDADTVIDDLDNCPMIPNANQADADGDGVGDACEADTDADTVIDDLDNCPVIPNANQADADGDGIGDVCEPDTDSDSVIDDLDNCPVTFNPDQSDLLDNGIGDACSPPITLLDLQVVAAEMDLPRPLQNFLRQAVKAANSGKDKVARKRLGHFMKEVMKYQAKGKLEAAAANRLIQIATQVVI